MAVVIDEVQVEAVETQAQPRQDGGQSRKPTGHPLDPNELAIAMRRRDQRLVRLWAD